MVTGSILMTDWIGDVF